MEVPDSTPMATPISAGTTVVQPTDVVVAIDQGFDWPGWLGLIVSLIALVVTGYIALIAYRLQKDAHEAAQQWRKEDKQQLSNWREEDTEQALGWRKEDLALQREHREEDLRERAEREVPRIDVKLEFRAPRDFSHSSGSFHATATNVGYATIQLDKAVLTSATAAFPWHDPFDFEKLPREFPSNRSKRFTWEAEKMNRELYKQGMTATELWIVCTDSFEREYLSEPLLYRIPAGWQPPQHS
jgi:hypothetical protein